MKISDRTKDVLYALSSLFADLDAHGGVMAVLLFLIAASDDEGVVDATNAQIGRAAGITEAMVIRHLKRLKGLGLIQCEGRTASRRIILTLELPMTARRVSVLRPARRAV